MRRRKHSAISSNGGSTTLKASGSVAGAASFTTSTGTATSQQQLYSLPPAPAFPTEFGSDAGSSAGSSSFAEVDSMRPVAPRARKRRRTILDAFNSISLTNSNNKKQKNQTSSHQQANPSNPNNSNTGTEGEETEDGADADSSQAVADEDGRDHEDITTSSIDDYDDDEDGDGQDMVDDSCLLLSDKEEAQRNVMFELVLGPMAANTKTRKNPVDVKIDAMIRNSREKLMVHSRQQQQKGGGGGGSHIPVPLAVQDDTQIDPPYARSQLPLSSATPVTTTNMATISSMSPSPPELTRSNSMPDLWNPSTFTVLHGNSNHQNNNVTFRGDARASAAMEE